MTPTISIIVPCYNQAQYLDECLQSVLDQTYKDWECIIVNDGSTDNTEELALVWTEADSRFKYLKMENGGVSRARNKGISRARSEWILPLDGDDKLGNRYLELAEKQLHLGFNLITSKVKHFGVVNSMRENEPFGLDELLYSAPICVSTFFRKNLWHKTGGFDENLHHGLEDTEFWINAMSKMELKFICLDYVGLHYRRKETSRSMNVMKDTKLNLTSKEYIVKKHAAIYASNLDAVSTLHFRVKRYERAISLLKKSTALRLLNYFGILKWVKQL